MRFRRAATASAPPPAAAAAAASARETGPSAPGAARRNQAGFVMLLGSLTMLQAVATDMYLPSLPEVAQDLGTGPAGAQFTITGMVLGGAVGQLVVGPLSDRMGRRRPALTGTALHVLLSLACMAAPTITVLAGLRLVQGFAAAAAAVVATAVIRDRFTGAEAARLMSRLMLVIGAAPLFAPTVGAVVADRWGWRAVFGVLAAVAAVVLVVAALRLPETLPPERRRRQGPGALARGYLEVLGDGRFRALAVMPGLMLAMIMSYVVGSPFVLREQYGLTGQQFSLVFALCGMALVAGTQANAAAVRRMGPARLLRLGAPAAALCSAVMIPVALTGVGGVVALFGALWCALFASGLVSPNAAALALTRHGERAGTAAATIGALQAGIAGAVSSLVGLLGGDAVAMTGVILASTVVTVLVLALATPAYRREGWVALEEPRETLVGTA
ncbi:MAG: multidrug effflux MFS transporter [Actinomycetales bacterium]|nr:multidrug effflux MFS transporter [Actinomycetales bacterium]